MDDEARQDKQSEICALVMAEAIVSKRGDLLVVLLPCLSALYGAAVLERATVKLGVNLYGAERSHEIAESVREECEDKGRIERLILAFKGD